MRPKSQRPQSSIDSFESVRSIAQRLPGELIVTKQKLRQARLIELVREKRDTADPNLGFASRPFVLCGLPIKRPPIGALLHERRNGNFLLQVTGHPQYGVPFGQDRLVPIFLATLAVRQKTQTITFRSAAEMLEVFGMQQGGSQYRRLVASFQRVFGATFFFTSDSQRERAVVMHQSRFNFMREARIWYSKHPEQPLLSGGFENQITLSDEFYREIAGHPIPTDLEAAKALSSAPAALDLFMWLSYRCYTCRCPEQISIFGQSGLASQLGNEGYARPRKFRERLERWLDLVRVLWPECPATVSQCGDFIVIRPATALKEA